MALQTITRMQTQNMDVIMKFYFLYIKAKQIRPFLISSDLIQSYI